MPKLKIPSVALASLIFTAALCPTAANSQSVESLPVTEGYSDIELYCSNRGQRVKMGGLSCLRVDGRAFLARCGMSLNNTAWQKVQDGCPSERHWISEVDNSTASSLSLESEAH
jgi:hypothetical protein